MQGRRVERVARLIREELGHLLLRRAKDPTLEGVTITDVEVSKDLSVAHVFFTSAPETRERVEDALSRAAPFLRRQVGAELHLKRTPELRFQYDEALEEGMHIDSILRDLSEDETGEEP